MDTDSIREYKQILQRLKQITPTGCRDRSLLQSHQYEVTTLENELAEIYYIMSTMEKQFVNDNLIRERTTP